MTATPKDCRIDAERDGKVMLGCIPTDLVGLVVEISEVLGQRNGAADYPREIGIGLRNVLELTSSVSRTNAYSTAEEYGHIAAYSPTSAPFTQEALSKTFEGQQFIFALHIRRSDFGRDGQPNGPYSTNIWRPAKRAWIIDLLKGSDGTSCPKLSPY